MTGSGKSDYKGIDIDEARAAYKIKENARIEEQKQRGDFDNPYKDTVDKYEAQIAQLRAATNGGRKGFVQCEESGDANLKRAGACCAITPAGRRRLRRSLRPKRRG